MGEFDLEADQNLFDDVVLKLEDVKTSTRRSFATLPSGT